MAKTRVHFELDDSHEKKLKDLQRLFFMEARTDVIRKLIDEAHEARRPKIEAMERAAAT